MSYLVTVAFDLNDVSDSDQETVYNEVHAALATMGFSRISRARDGTVVKLPQFTAVRVLRGPTAGSLVEQISKSVVDAFRSRNLKSTILITAGEHWAWGAQKI